MLASYPLKGMYFLIRFCIELFFFSLQLKISTTHINKKYTVYCIYGVWQGLFLIKTSTSIQLFKRAQIWRSWEIHSPTQKKTTSSWNSGNESKLSNYFHMYYVINLNILRLVENLTKVWNMRRVRTRSDLEGTN